MHDKHNSSALAGKKFLKIIIFRHQNVNVWEIFASPRKENLEDSANSATCDGITASCMLVYLFHGWADQFPINIFTARLRCLQFWNIQIRLLSNISLTESWTYKNHCQAQSNHHSQLSHFNQNFLLSNGQLLVIAANLNTAFWLMEGLFRVDLNTC